MARKSTPLPPAAIADIKARQWNDREIADRYGLKKHTVNYYRVNTLGLPGLHTERRRIPASEEHLTAVMTAAELQERWGVCRSAVYRAMARSNSKRVKPVKPEHESL